MYRIIKPLLFLLSPEKAHAATVKLFSLSLKIPILNQILKSAFQSKSTVLQKEWLGLKFKNPVGLAAGFDKNGSYLNEMRHLGFGFIEVGTVTPKPQIGNPQPRLFRLVKDQAVINRMGFNNEGVDALAKRLSTFDKKGLIIGGNIGKNKDTPNEKAVDDYLICFEKLHDYVDYFVVNVSSPNTPNLRALQEKEPLQKLLNTLVKANNQKSIQRPILLKIAPDLTNGQLDDIISIVQSTKIAGVIATNTTIDRKNLITPKQIIDSIGNGGLSGAPLKQRSTEVIRYLSEKSDNSLFIIGVGGIDNPAEAVAKIKAGATLIQIYSGLIYSGPMLVKNINTTLQKSPIYPPV